MKSKIIEEKNGIYFTPLSKQDLLDSTNKIKYLINANSENIFFDTSGDTTIRTAMSGITYDNVDTIYNNIVNLQNEAPKDFRVNNLDEVLSYDAEVVKDILVSYSSFKKVVMFERVIEEREQGSLTVDVDTNVDELNDDDVDYDFDVGRSTSMGEIVNTRYVIDINLPEIKYYNFNYFNKKVA